MPASNKRLGKLWNTPWFWTIPQAKRRIGNGRWYCDCATNLQAFPPIFLKFRFFPEILKMTLHPFAGGFLSI